MSRMAADKIRTR